MSATKIEWATKVWNPITGCSKVSEGCANCYAEKFAKRLQNHPNKQISDKYSNGFNPSFDEPSLTEPLKWKKPQRIFVCSMGDLFHENIPFEYIDAIFRVMSDSDYHTYMILTKRPQRMVKFYQWKSKQFNIPWQAKDNVWIGVTTENQKRAEERIPILLNIPAKVHFISCEPLLGDIDLEHWSNTGCPSDLIYQLDWVITGGETGNGARPSHLSWFKSLQTQCEEAQVPFFFKNWGHWFHFDNLPDGGETFVRIGKKESGQLLEKVSYNEFPTIQKP